MRKAGLFWLGPPSIADLLTPEQITALSGQDVMKGILNGTMRQVRLNCSKRNHNGQNTGISSAEITPMDRFNGMPIFMKSLNA